MKFYAVSAILSALVISVVASSAMAANPAGPKPKCRSGQILVIEQSKYQCKAPGIKSQSSSSQNTATGSKRAPKAPKIPVKKAQVLMPDLTILKAVPMKGTGAGFLVTVKNIGTKGTPPVVLYGTHVLPDNTSWAADAIVPALGAGATKVMKITIPPANYTRGDRVAFRVDYTKKVKEKSELNNYLSIKYMM